MFIFLYMIGWRLKSSGLLTLVTESLTLMAGIFSSLFFNILYRLWTPVVVSSDTPRIPRNTKVLKNLELYINFDRDE